MACVPIRDLTMQSANWLSASWFVRELTSPRVCYRRVLRRFQILNSVDTTNEAAAHGSSSICISPLMFSDWQRRGRGFRLIYLDHYYLYEWNG